MVGEARARRQARHKNTVLGPVCVKRILGKDGANTSYSRLTIMYYRRAQPTTRGLENGYEESDEKDFDEGFVEESSGEEGCEEDRSEEGAGEEDSGEEARQEGSEEEVTSL
jgi:hypothetical protein